MQTKQHDEMGMPGFRRRGMPAGIDPAGCPRHAWSGKPSRRAEEYRTAALLIDRSLRASGCGTGGGGAGTPPAKAGLRRALAAAVHPGITRG